MPRRRFRCGRAEAVHAERPASARRAARVLYVLNVEWVRAWRPAVPGIAEVFHAHFVEHAYPLHTHDTWTLLVVDDGVSRYDLERAEHGATADEVTLLPPHVPHDGRAATRRGFRKRVLYLDATAVPDSLVGAAAGTGRRGPAWRAR